MIKKIIKRVEDENRNCYGEKEVKFNKGEKDILKAISKLVKTHANVTFSAKLRGESRDVKSLDYFNFYTANWNEEGNSVCLCIDKNIDQLPNEKKLIHMDLCLDSRYVEKSDSLIILQLDKEKDLEIITYNTPIYMDNAIVHVKNSYITSIRTENNNFLCNFEDSRFWFMNPEGKLLRTSSYGEWEWLLERQDSKPRSLKKFKKAKKYIDLVTGS